MQEQIPQQIQQTQETMRERTRETKIAHIHHTGLHSPERDKRSKTQIKGESLLTLGAAGCDIVRTLSSRDALPAPEAVNGRGEALLGVLPHGLLLQQPPGAGWEQRI